MNRRIQQILRQIGEYCFLPISVQCALLLLGVYLVSQPAVFDFIYDQAVDFEGERYEDGIAVARALSGEDSFELVSQRLNGGTMGPREIYHFEDVREKLRMASLLLGGSVLILGLIIWKVPVHWMRVMKASVLIYVITGLIAAVWAVMNFRSFFRTLHWWVFQDDTWILPNSCYSLKLYPYAVWKWLGGLILGGSFIALLVITGIIALKSPRSADRE